MAKNKKGITPNISIENQVKEVLEQNLRPVAGRFDCKELNEKIFLNDIFQNFIVSLKGQEASAMKIRVKLQEVLQNNLRSAIGNFHSKEFNETCFMSDLFRNFELKQKT